MLRVALGIALVLSAVSSVSADTITSKEIAAGISEKKTEIQQEAWWKENMAGKRHEVTGKVYDVEEGTFSGYWVRMNLGNGIDVQCGMSSEHEELVTSIEKGANFTCVGDVASSWTAIFGVLFTIDFTG